MPSRCIPRPGTRELYLSLVFISTVYRSINSHRQSKAPPLALSTYETRSENKFQPSSYITGVTTSSCAPPRNLNLPKIQLQILSDLHLEAPAAYDTFEITPRGPVLALLGDIGRDPGWIQFLERQLSLFRTVLLVLGNHEPYNSSWARVREQIRDFNSAHEKNRHQGQGELVLLDQGRYDVTDDFTILGCTLHS